MLPMFPLQLVVFPGEDLNLHIFEPRYRELLADCEEEGISFGIPPFIDNAIMEVGTEVELVEVARRYPNGELDIRTRGTGVFKIDTFFHQFPGKLYAGAEVTSRRSRETGDVQKARKLADLARHLFEIMQVQVDLPDDPARLRTFALGHQVGLSLQQEYELLCQSDERARQDYMLDHLRRLIPMARELERLKEKVQMNGHFRNITPPDIRKMER